MKRSVLVTGAAGFIGSHLVDRLLETGTWTVTALDSFDPFYDPGVKARNVAAHLLHSDYRLVRADIRNIHELRRSIVEAVDVIVHLATKAGVQPSLRDPLGYQSVNVEGTQNLLEFARELGTSHFVFASSSSVYGINPDVPWSEANSVLLPISPYASTKVSGELLGHVYSHLYGMRFIALRFFTVYGPRQRPDLAIHKFARRMLLGRELTLYGDGSMRRDYTYVDDVVDGVLAAIDYAGSQYEVINLGNSTPVGLLDLVRLLEQATGVTSRIRWLPEQPGDVPQTYADITKGQRLLGYQPSASLEDGLERFIIWLRADMADESHVARGVHDVLE